MNMKKGRTLWQLLILKSSVVIRTLSEDKDGWKKQLTCTSWGKYNPKFDLSCLG